jgi:hypothetical protein
MLDERLLMSNSCKTSNLQTEVFSGLSILAIEIFLSLEDRLPSAPHTRASRVTRHKPPEFLPDITTEKPPQVHLYHTMSTLLRLSKTLRMIRTPKNTKTMSSHFFSPSSLTRSRFYFSGGAFSAHRLQETNNLAVLYTLMGTNIAVFGYAMYLKQQAMQGFQQPFVKFMRTMTLNLSEVIHGHCTYFHIRNACETFY